MLVVVGLLLGSACSLGPRPRAATPGQMVRLKTFKAAFSGAEPVSVRVGDREANLIRVLGPRKAQLIVPKVAAGQVDVEVRAGERLLARYEMEVLEPRFQRLVLAMEGGTVEHLATQAACEAPQMLTMEDGMRLGWEVVDPDGGLIASGVADHPSLQRHEVYGEPDKDRMHIVKAPARTVFTLTLAQTAPGCTLRLFEIVDQAQMKRGPGTEDGRLIAEVALGKGGAR